MLYDLILCTPFRKQLDSILKHYPQSEQKIRKKINDLGDNPLQGDSYPGFGLFKVSKIRIGLKEYKLAANKGLRLIFLFLEEKQKVVPLVIYKKGSVGAERDVKKLIIKTLKETLDELEQAKEPGQ